LKEISSVLVSDGFFPLKAGSISCKLLQVAEELLPKREEEKEDPYSV